MIETIVSVLLILLGTYLALGLAFAVGFVSRGVQQIDPAAKSASLGFKLLIIPGCMVFWPFLWMRWKIRPEPPIEYSRHRTGVRKDN